MTQKCSKYESLFVFGNEEDLQKHLENCPECRLEHEKMQRVALLVKEVKPFISRKSFYKKHMAKIAACFIFISIGFYGITQYSNYTIASQDDLKLVKDNSIIAQMGLPADEYGLLDVEH